MDNCGMDNFPLTLTLSLKGRGNFIVLLVVGCCVLLDAASVALAETWRCTKPDGSVFYSDQNLSGECRKLEALPPLLRAPSGSPAPAEEGDRKSTRLDFSHLVISHAVFCLKKKTWSARRA